MKPENKKSLSGIAKQTDCLLADAYNLSEALVKEAGEATDRLLANEDAANTPKLFLKYHTVDTEQRHIAAAYKHLLEASKELQAAQSVFDNFQRGIQG